MFQKFSKTVLDSIRWLSQGRSSTAATLQTLLTRVFILAINMATGIITARVLAPLGRGEQAAMGLWPQFLAYAMTLGLPSALLYNLKRHPDKKSEMFSAALVLGTAMGLVATLTGIIFIPSWLNQYSTEVIQEAQWLMLTAPLALLTVTFTAALEADNNFATANQVRYLPPLLTLVTLGVLALTQTLTPLTSTLAYLLSGIPIFFWMLGQLWNRFHPRWYGIGKYYKPLLSYGLRSYGIDLLGTLSGQVDQALIVGLLPPASMGLYVIALSLSRMLGVFHSSIVTVLFPKTAARPVAEVVDLTGRAARVSLAFILLVAVAAIILGPMFLGLLYGSKYMGAVPVFRILVIESVISNTAWILIQAFMALGKPGTVTILQGIALGLTVPLLLVFIPAYGLLGAGLALLCSSTVRAISALVCYPLVLKVRPPGLIMTREDLYFILDKFNLNKT